MVAYDLSQDEEVVYYEFLTTKAPDVPDQFQITNIQPTTTGVTFTVTPQSADEWYCAWITTKSTYESFEPESYIQGIYYGLNNIAVDKQMTMSDYVKSIAKRGTAEWSNYDGDLKPKTDYVIIAFYVDPNNEDQLKVYDYAYTKAEFRTETPETEISLTLGDIKNLTDNGDGTAEVTVHVKASWPHRIASALTRRPKSMRKSRMVTALRIGGLLDQLASLLRCRRHLFTRRRRCHCAHSFRCRTGILPHFPSP